MSNAITHLDRYFVSAVTLDEAGVAHLNVTELVSDGDTNLTIRAKHGSIATANATPITIAIATLASGDVVGVDAYVTVRGTGKRAKIKLSALVWGNGSTATLQGATSADIVTNDAGISADIIVTGPSVLLEITGIVAALTWGFEVRSQLL